MNESSLKETSTSSLFRLDEPQKNIELFPSSFHVPSTVLNAVDLLRDQIRSEDDDERAGVIHSDSKGTLEFFQTQHAGDPVIVNYLVLCESDVVSIETKKWMPFDGERLPEVIFIRTSLAKNHMKLMKECSLKGIKIILDRYPILIAHSHPSGNLPSLGDLRQVFYISEDLQGDDVNVTECVITLTETFFLIPSTKTPDLIDPSFSRKLSTRLNEITNEIASNHEQTQTASSVTNGARYKLLQETLPQYSAAMYVLPRGQSDAQRVF